MIDLAWVRYNSWRIPVVLLVRAPLMLPLLILFKIGQGAEWLGDLVDGYLPTLETPKNVRRYLAYEREKRTKGGRQ